MIDLSKKNIVRIANETFFIKDNVEKVMRLIDILETLFSSEWKDKLALKGGTAINLFYRNLPRLSVDIDLDYLGQTKEEAVADKESIRTYLKSALFQKGYALSDASKYHYALDSYVFQYQNNGGNRDNIKVEINFLDRAHILPLSKTKIAAFGYNGEAEIAVVRTVRKQVRRLDRSEQTARRLRRLRRDRARPFFRQRLIEKVFCFLQLYRRRSRYFGERSFHHRRREE